MPDSAHRPIPPTFSVNGAADTEPGCCCVYAGFGLRRVSVGRHVAAAGFHRFASRAAEDTNVGEATADAEVLQARLSFCSPDSVLRDLHRKAVKQLRCQTRAFSFDTEDLYSNKSLRGGTPEQRNGQLLPGFGSLRKGWGIPPRRSTLEALQLLAQGLAIDAEDSRRLSLVASDLSHDVADVIPLNFGEGPVETAFAAD